jgi:hypothetical protein
MGNIGGLTMIIGQPIYGVEEMDHMSNLRAWARSYFARGWKVIPVDIIRDSYGKKSCRFYFEYSKLDMTTYDYKAFSRIVDCYFPDRWFSGLRLLTTQSDVVVIDRDGPCGKIIIDALGISPITTHNSSKDGHLWFKGDASIPRYIRQELQYDVPSGVFVAPSIVYKLDRFGTRVVDGVYRWSDVVSISNIDSLILPVMPEALKTFLIMNAKQHTQEQIEAYKEWRPTREYIAKLLLDDTVGKGGRHKHLLKIAGAIIKAGETVAYAKRVLKTLCEKREWWDKKRNVDSIVDWIYNQQNKGSSS